MIPCVDSRSSNPASFALQCDIPSGDVRSDHVSLCHRQKNRRRIVLIVIDGNPGRCGPPEMALGSRLE
jgi:hypothetical protein